MSEDESQQQATELKQTLEQAKAAAGLSWVGEDSGGQAIDVLWWSGLAFEKILQQSQDEEKQNILRRSKHGH